MSTEKEEPQDLPIFTAEERERLQREATKENKTFQKRLRYDEIERSHMHEDLPAEPRLIIERDAAYIWLALRDGDVVCVQDWTPRNHVRTQVYRFNERLPKDMRMRLASLQIRHETDAFSSIYIVAAGLTNVVARGRLREWLASWLKQTGKSESSAPNANSNHADNNY